MIKTLLPSNISLRISRSFFLILCLFCLTTPGLAASTIKLANTNSLLTSLIRLADDQDLYNQFGIQLELVDKATGEAALVSLLEQQADIAVISTTPFVKYALKHPNLRLIASIGQSNNRIKLVARKDRGITTAEDLRGKRIGTQPGGTVHLFLKRLLAKHGMTEGDITPVFMPADRLPTALANGLIDAICSPEPYLTQAMEQKPEDLRIISVPDMYIKSVNLVTTDEFLQTDRSKGLIPLLQALHAAEQRLAEEPEEMTALLSKQLEQSPDRVKDQLHEARLRLNMDSELLASLEAIARWLQQPMQNSEDTSSIDFLSYLHTPLLARVKPQGVNLSP
jgi:NitT/TauT family transport system substrate-binding protein